MIPVRVPAALRNIYPVSSEGYHFQIFLSACGTDKGYELSGCITGLSDATIYLQHRIDKSYVSYFSDTKINLFVGVNISEPKTLIEEYLNGTLQSNVKNISEQ